MQQTAQPRKERENWREVLSLPERPHAIVAALVFFFACLVLPLSADVAGAAALFIIVCLVLCYTLVRSVRALLWYLVPLFLLYSVSAMLPAPATPFTLPASFLAIVFGGACGAFLLIHYHDLRKYPYLIALPVAAYLAAALLTGDWVRACLALLPLAMAIVTALCALLYLSHNDSLLAIAGVLAATLAVAGIVTLGVTGNLGTNPLTFMADALRTGVFDLFAEQRALYAELGISELMMTDVDIANIAAMLVNLLPGLFAVACTVTAFLIWRTLMCLLLCFRSVPRLPRRMAAFSMSVASALVFLAALFISLLANGETVTLGGVVAQNVTLVLEPGLALVGFASLFQQPRRSCFSHLLSIGLIFILLTNPATGLSLAAFLGAFHIVSARFFPSPQDKGEQ